MKDLEFKAWLQFLEILANTPDGEIIDLVPSPATPNAYIYEPNK